MLSFGFYDYSSVLNLVRGIILFWFHSCFGILFLYFFSLAPVVSACLFFFVKLASLLSVFLLLLVFFSSPLSVLLLCCFYVLHLIDWFHLYLVLFPWLTLSVSLLCSFSVFLLISPQLFLSGESFVGKYFALASWTLYFQNAC